MFCFTTIRINKKKKKNKVKRSMALVVEEALVLHHQMTHAYKSLSYFQSVNITENSTKLERISPRVITATDALVDPTGW